MILPHRTGAVRSLQLLCSALPGFGVVLALVAAATSRRLIGGARILGQEQPELPKNARELVLAKIEQSITQGKLHVGDRLPNERSFAAELGVSRSSLREVLRALEVMGVISASVGTGPNSGSIVQADSSGALATLLRIHTSLQEFSIGELVATRIMIETWAVRSVGQLRDSHDIERLHDLLWQMGRQGLTIREYNALDTQFHVAIAESSGNRLVRTLMQALRDAIEREMVSWFDRLPDWQAVTSNLTSEHANILKALEVGDGELAAETVTAHITGFYLDQSGNHLP
jgi:GntR family transcriptional repressor for pyruvate dehydrogenase complex